MIQQFHYLMDMGKHVYGTSVEKSLGSVKSSRLGFWLFAYKVSSKNGASHGVMSTHTR